MGSFKPEELKKYWELLLSVGVVRYLADIYDFFFRPKVFWGSFICQSPSRKFWRTFTYTAICVAIVFCLFDDTFKFPAIADFLLTETGSLLPFWFVSVAIIFSCQGFRQLPKAASLAFFLSFFIKALFCPIQCIFLKLYNNTDFYAYLFVAEAITIAAELYLLYVSIFVLHREKNKKTILTGILTGIIAFAIVDGSDFLFGRVKSKGYDNFANKVVQEQEDRFDGLFTNFLIPQAVVITDGVPIRFYLYAMPTDTMVYRLEIDDGTYMENIKADITLIEERLPKIYRKTNIEFAKDLLEIKKAIVYTNDSKTFSKEPRCHVSYKDSTNFGCTVYDYNKNIWEDNYRLMKKYCWKYCQYDLAMSISFLQFAYRPLLIIPYLKDDTKALKRDRTLNAWDAFFKLSNNHPTYNLPFK